jgi:signal transduction histidine kinase
MPDNPSKRARQLSRLIELNHLIARLDPQTFFQSVVEMAAEFTSSDYCSILEYDPEQKCLKFIAGPWLQMPRMREISVPLEGSIAGDTFRTAETIILTHADQDPRLFSEVQNILEIRTHRLLSVPIQYQDQVLGVMQAVNKFEGEYDHEDTAFLLSLAAQSGSMLRIRKLEQSAIQLEAEAEALEKRKNDFIAITSHELRTPLGVILGNATFLREVMQNHELRPQIDAIVVSALRMKELIETLTRESNVQTGTARVRIEPVQLNRLVEDLVTSYQSEARRKEILLSVQLEERQIVIEGEADKISIAIQNLLRNALSFTDNGGAIDVSLRTLPGYAQFSISDTGIGIPLDEQERIFDRFYQVESHLTRRHGGMGLGLSVAKSMVEIHGGQIWVRSKPGAGSTFSFILPEKQPDGSPLLTYYEHTLPSGQLDTGAAGPEEADEPPAAS